MKSLTTIKRLIHLTPEERDEQKLSRVCNLIIDSADINWRKFQQPIRLHIVGQAFGTSLMKWGFMEIIDTMSRQGDITLVRNRYLKGFIYPYKIWADMNENEQEAAINSLDIAYKPKRKM